MTGEGINPATDPDNNEERGVLHRVILAQGDVSEVVKSGIELEALARGDIDLFIPVTQELSQSDDPAIVKRAGQMLEVYADFATGHDPTENPALQELFDQ